MSTLLAGLKEKRCIARSGRERQYEYQPAISWDGYVLGIVEDIAGPFMDENRFLLLNAVLRERKLSEEEKDTLRGMIDD